MKNGLTKAKKQPGCFGTIARAELLGRLSGFGAIPEDACALAPNVARENAQVRLRIAKVAWLSGAGWCRRIEFRQALVNRFLRAVDLFYCLIAVRFQQCQGINAVPTWLMSLHSRSNVQFHLLHGGRLTSDWESGMLRKYSV